MAEGMFFALILLGSVGSGLIAGLFFAFSTFIMQAFDRLPPVQAIAAMNAINVTILNPLFFAAFFGTALLSVVLALFAALGPGGPEALLITIGAAAYMLGAILVTMTRNVPLNNALARFDPATDAASAWSSYRVPWTRWNHVRTISCLAATALFAAALG